MTIDGIEIEVVRKAVRGLRIVVKPGGHVRLTVPWLTPGRQARAWLEEHMDWIRATRERMLNVTPAPRRELPVVTAEQRDALVTYLNEAVPRWLSIMGEAPLHEIRIRNMRSQWGNCRWRERIVTFNLQLALVPHELVDYIIVHELAHLKVQNHSAAFHAHVQQFIPDEKQRRRTLNKILKV